MSTGVASRGPVPKRVEERAGHRAKGDRPDRVSMAEPVKAPPASGSWHPEARRWYRSLLKSGQSQWYEPSDWAFARLLAELLTGQLNSGRPSAEMLRTIFAGMSSLATTEGDRRRMRIEVDRVREEPADEQARAAVLAQVTRLADHA